MNKMHKLLQNASLLEDAREQLFINLTIKMKYHGISYSRPFQIIQCRFWKSNRYWVFCIVSRKKIGSFLSPALDQFYIIVIQCGVGAESEQSGISGLAEKSRWNWWENDSQLQFRRTPSNQKVIQPERDNIKIASSLTFNFFFHGPFHKLLDNCEGNLF